MLVLKDLRNCLCDAKIKESYQLNARPEAGRIYVDLGFQPLNKEGLVCSEHIV